jgi:hypothetical protein
VLAQLVKKRSITRHKIGFRRDEKRDTPNSNQSLENSARQTESPLCRLVRISSRSQADHIAFFQAMQLAAEGFPVPVFGINFSFEGARFPEFHELVRETGVAVFAAVLTTPVGVDCPIKRNATRLAAIEKFPRRETPIFHVPLFNQQLAFRRQASDTRKRNEFVHRDCLSMSIFAFYSLFVKDV